MLPSKEEYKKLNEKASPNSHLGKNMLMAFLFGGGICAFAQALSQIYRTLDVPVEKSLSLASITLVGLTALLTGLKIFDNIATVAGAGLLVPITGFANSMVSPAMEFKSEGMVLGLGVKMFTLAGPVLVYGTSAAALYGVILWIIELF